jgi:phage-related baseplate assembly protein
MSGFNAINLSGLPAPEIVEALDYEAVLAEMLSELRARDTAFSALVESDPAYKVLEVVAYREVLLRQRVNDAAKAVMVAYAVGTDLDNLGALFNVSRKEIFPGDSDAMPPISPIYEPDGDFRRRVQLAFEGLSTAGPAQSYIFHALSVPGVADVAVRSVTPGTVDVAVMSQEGNGTATANLLTDVEAVVASDKVRPLTDTVNVVGAVALHFSVVAQLQIFAGPDGEVVRRTAEASVRAYLSESHKLGSTVSLSGLYSALHVDGVQNAILLMPSANVVAGFGEVPHCVEIRLTWEVV